MEEGRAGSSSSADPGARTLLSLPAEDNPRAEREVGVNPWDASSFAA